MFLVRWDRFPFTHKNQGFKSRTNPNPHPGGLPDPCHPGQVPNQSSIPSSVSDRYHQLPGKPSGSGSELPASFNGPKGVDAEFPWRKTTTCMVFLDIFEIHSHHFEHILAEGLRYAHEYSRWGHPAVNQPGLSTTSRFP